MHDFKVGDRVRIINPINATNYGLGDIAKVISSGTSGLVIDCGDGKQDFVTTDEVEPTEPDVITIDRADLPEVTSYHDGAWLVDHEILGARTTSAEHRRQAMLRLALAEFLEAREKAAEEADLRLCRRRDALAETLSGVIGTQYGVRNRDLRNAIDMIIELQDNRG